MQDLNGLVLAANHALALLDEADRHGIGNAIRGRFVSIEDAAEQFKVSVIFLEERASQDVAKQENDAKHFMRLDAAVNDALGQVPSVGLQILYTPSFQG